MTRLGVRLDVVPEITTEQRFELVRLAEERGYETLWVPEGTDRDALTHLAAFAVVTQRIRLGTGILPVFSRTPTTMAMSAAGLDILSNHRFILGLGVSGPGSVEGNHHGIPFDKPVTRLKESVEIVRRLLNGERVVYKGKIFNVRNAYLGLTRPAPVPIYLAALGPRMVELAGQMADGVLLNWASPSYIEQALGCLERGAGEVGRKLEDVDVACYVRTAVTDDLEAVRAPLRQKILAYFNNTSYYPNHFQNAGFKDEVQAVMRYLGEGNRDKAATAISDGMQRQLAVFGPAEYCRKEIERRASLGLKMVVVAPFAVGDAFNSYRTTVGAFTA